jgi:UDP:flavonoid glycosyltransferase YjiC (YdhE family)
MKVLFTTLRTTSHFLPLVPFVQACRRGGHEVAVAAPAELAERVAAVGAEFFPFGHPGDAGLGPIWARLRTIPDDQQTRVVISEIFAGACAGAALPGLLETVQRFQPSIIVRESQEYAAVIVGDKLAIPHVRVSITTASKDDELLSYALPELDKHRGSAGAPPDPSGASIANESVLTLFPAALDAPKFAHAEFLRFRAPRLPAPSLPDWWSSGAGDPFVYVTLGTVAGSMDVVRDTYRAVLAAVGGLPVRVLFTIGAELPIESLGEVPANVRVERFVPQDDVLPHARAVLCHGGSGTVLGALAAGVPLVVVPMFADQPYNAERVAAVGAGVAIPHRDARPEGVRQALVRVLAEESFRASARKIADEIGALPLVDDASGALERLARFQLGVTRP